MILWPERQKKNRKDEYYTFNKFQEILKVSGNETGKGKWDEIFSKYLRLRDWYNDSWYYHRIGYLVAVGDNEALLRIFKEAFPDDGSIVGLKEFKLKIQQLIAETLVLPDDIKSFRSLDYNKHYSLIYRILTLYNVMLCDKLADVNVRYPFFKHNDGKNGGWTLEHIHAQNSEELKGAAKWKEWVSSHLESLKRIKKRPLEGMINFDSRKAETLIARMEAYDKNGTEKEFKDILGEFAVITSIKGEAGEEDKHLIANLALLSATDNPSLNKSTFDVKRVKIAKNLSSNYVPIGTERVFMKAIAGAFKDEDGKDIPGSQYVCDSFQMFFWGPKDREAYLSDIEETLKDYRDQLNPKV